MTRGRGTPKGRTRGDGQVRHQPDRELAALHRRAKDLLHRVGSHPGRIALLEDRPIYVFDEWTADQDAHFREHFYTAVLPRLRQQGKTVLMATHDDRYWHLADRLVKLELGRLVG